VKRFLLGTTALAAVGAFAGAANAQSANEPIKLGLGGYWNAAGGAAITQSGPEKQGHFNQNGTSKLDNGLSVGVVVQFRSEAAAVQSDTEKRSYVRFLGDFGEIRFGDQDDARLTKGFGAPIAGVIFGLNSPYFEFNNAPMHTNSTTTPVDKKRAQRIAYFTPTIAGFSFGASYAPNSEKGNLPNTAAAFATSRDPGQNSQAWSLAGTYDNKFGDFRLQGWAATSQTRQEASPGTAVGAMVENPRSYDGGAQVGFGPVKFGGSYEYVQNYLQTTTGAGLNKKTWDLGAVYTVGPFATSLDFINSRQRGYGNSTGNNVTLLSSPVGAASANSADAHEDQVQLIGAYVLGPGIELDAAVEFDHYTSGVAQVAGNVSTNDFNSTEIMFGTALSF
jgi:outer membrane protein OmpU